MIDNKMYDYINDFKEFLEISEDNDNVKIKVNNEISSEQLIDLIKKVYEFESNSEHINILLLLKGLDITKIEEAVKYSLTREDLRDPIMILNILNFIKTYNTLSDDFFENENIYVSSLDDFLDLKLALRKELKEFSQKLSIYFISLFKSYNKTDYVPTDVHMELPWIYRSIMLSSDILTLSGIFAVSEHFDTERCVYIDEAFKYVSSLLMKNSISIACLNNFLEGKQNGNSSS